MVYIASTESLIATGNLLHSMACNQYLYQYQTYYLHPFPPSNTCIPSSPPTIHPTKPLPWGSKRETNHPTSMTSLRVAHKQFTLSDASLHSSSHSLGLMIPTHSQFANSLPRARVDGGEAGWHRKRLFANLASTHQPIRTYVAFLGRTSIRYSIPLGQTRKSCRIMARGGGLQRRKYSDEKQ